MLIIENKIIKLLKLKPLIQNENNVSYYRTKLIDLVCCKTERILKHFFLPRQISYKFKQ